MSNEILFQMLGQHRRSLIAGHLFYVEQAYKRLLSQFEDIESEAENAAETWLKENGQHFNPDYHDVGDFYEAAHDAGIEFYQLLTDMRGQTRLSVVAGMYHEWDKQLRQWLSDEIRHWHKGKSVEAQIWKVDLGKIVALLDSLGWHVSSRSYFVKLDACRLIVNVYKHGNGNSLDDLKKSYPGYLLDQLSANFNYPTDLRYLDYSYLSVSNDQLQEFSNAIVSFWEDVPDRIFDHDDISPPSWFEKAMLAD